MSRIPEPGCASGRRRSGTSWQSHRPSTKVRDPQLLIHVRPLSSSKPGATEGDSELASNRLKLAPNRFPKLNMRTSLDRLNKKISSKTASRGPVSPGTVKHRSRRGGRSVMTPDSKQVEGSPRQQDKLKQNCEDFAVAFANLKDEQNQIIHESEPVVDVCSTSPEAIIAESDTLSAWQLLQKAFQKYEDTTCYRDMVVTNDQGLKLSDADDRDDWNMDNGLDLNNCRESDLENNDIEEEEEQKEKPDTKDDNVNNTTNVGDDLDVTLSDSVNDSYTVINADNESSKDLITVDVKDDECHGNKLEVESTFEMGPCASISDDLDLSQCDSTLLELNRTDVMDSNAEESQCPDRESHNEVINGFVSNFDYQIGEELKAVHSFLATSSDNTEKQLDDHFENVVSHEEMHVKGQYLQLSTQNENDDSKEICSSRASGSNAAEHNVESHLEDDNGAECGCEAEDGTYPIEHYNRRLQHSDMRDFNPDNSQIVGKRDAENEGNELLAIPTTADSIASNLDCMENLTSTTPCSLPMLDPNETDIDSNVLEIEKHLPSSIILRSDTTKEMYGNDNERVDSSGIISKPFYTDVTIHPNLGAPDPAKTELDCGIETFPDAVDIQIAVPGSDAEFQDPMLRTDPEAVKHNQIENCNDKHLQHPSTEEPPNNAMDATTNAELTGRRDLGADSATSGYQYRSEAKHQDNESRMDAEIDCDIEESRLNFQDDSLDAETEFAMHNDTVDTDSDSNKNIDSHDIRRDLNSSPYSHEAKVQQNVLDSQVAEFGSDLASFQFLDSSVELHFTNKASKDPSEDGQASRASLLSKEATAPIPEHASEIASDYSKNNVELLQTASQDFVNVSATCSAIANPSPIPVHPTAQNATISPEVAPDATPTNSRKGLQRSRSLPLSVSFRQNSTSGLNTIQSTLAFTDKPADLRPCCNDDAVHDSQRNSRNLPITVSNQLSDEVRLVRNQIQQALCLVKPEIDSIPKPKAVIHRRRYRPRQRSCDKPNVQDDVPINEGETKEPVEGRSNKEGKHSEVREDVSDRIAKEKNDQAVQAIDDHCCYETRCCRCPISFDIGTEPIISCSRDIDVQCHVQLDVHGVQCCAEAASAITQTNTTEVVQQTIQTEKELYQSDNCMQTDTAEFCSVQVQCRATTMATETQTITDVVDAAVQHIDESKIQSFASKPSVDTDFSDLDQHVNQFIRSISPGRSHLHERQKRHYIESIEDPGKGVLVLDDGRPLKCTGPLGPRTLVSLNIGGQRFDVLRSTLSRYRETLLGRIASSPLPVYIDRSPVLFPFIIDTYRTGTPYLSSTKQSKEYLEALRDEAHFYQIENQMFPNGIEALTESRPEVTLNSKTNKVLEEDGQCNQFELCERCVLVPGMSATFTPRTNETLILDTISGRGQLLLDVEHGLRSEMNVNCAVVFDSAAHFNSANGDAICVETSYPHGASYTFFMLDRQSSSLARGKANGEETSCEFCGLLQRVDPSEGRLSLCSSCHSRLPEVNTPLGAERVTSSFQSNTRVEQGNQLTITMRIICTFDKSSRTKVATVKKGSGNVAVLCKSDVDNGQHLPGRARSPPKKAPKPQMFSERQQLLKQRSTSPVAFQRQVKPSPLPLIRRPPMA